MAALIKASTIVDRHGVSEDLDDTDMKSHREGDAKARPGEKIWATLAL